MIENLWLYGIGLSAQLLFSARLIIQWIKSEKVGKVVSPTIFWQLSLMASFLLITYGILRRDPIIILGQIVSYCIYIRNLQYKNAWKYIPIYFKFLVILLPVITITWLLLSSEYNWNHIMGNPEISKVMLIWGAFGQVMFGMRFIYQWYVSEKSKKSVLPLGFWLISLIGSLLIISYGFYRMDPVLILGQIFGLFMYIRNIQIGLKITRASSKFTNNRA